jgi:hypothetical protein
MKLKAWTLRRLVCCLAIIWLAGQSSVSFAVERLVWNKEKNSVAAEISTWDLDKLLENIASATGWQIFVEPTATHAVSTKFKDRAPGDALRLLLGDLSYALLPQTNAPAKLYVFKTALHEATRLVRAPAKAAAVKPKPIADEWIVTVKPGTNIDELAKKMGAKVIGRAEGLNTYRLKFDDATAAEAAGDKLKSDPSVASIDYNYSVPTPDQPQNLSLSSSMPPMNLVPKAVPDGNRIIVGLIDTAVQPKGTGLEGFFLPSISVAGEANPPADQPTHGTSMAETMARSMSAVGSDTESRVRFLNVNVYGNNPSTTTFEVALGVYKAINAGAMIINMSLGGAGDNSMLHQVIQSGHDQGVIFFGSAGNEPVATPTLPAAYPEVVAVTAGDRQGNVASYANYGSFVDVIAPGSSIVNFNNQSWLVMGTSASSAYMAGLAAAMADGSGKSFLDVETAIRSRFRFSSGK